MLQFKVELAGVYLQFQKICVIFSKEEKIRTTQDKAGMEITKMKEETRDAAMYLLLLGFTHEIKSASEVTKACEHAFTVWNDADCPREQIQWPVIHWFQKYLDTLANRADHNDFAHNQPQWHAWLWYEWLYSATRFEWKRPESWWYDTLALLSDPVA
jgi:uncharacterized NAD(P)/FAD-binding protein YdhS